MDFPVPPADIAEKLDRTTGPLFRAIGMTLNAAPCLRRTSCKEGGFTGRGFVTAVEALCLLIGERPTDMFREHLLTVLFEMEMGRINLDDLDVPGQEPSFDSSKPLDGAEDIEYFSFVSKYDQTPTYRLLAEVMKSLPGADFCAYIAASIPAQLRARVDYRLYDVLERACVRCELLGEGRILLQLTSADDVLILQ